MGSITFAIFGLILQFLSYFILFYNSMTGYTRLTNKFCLTDGGELNRFGNFIKYFCWGNRTIYVGIKRFFYTISALIFAVGTTLQIIGFFVIENMSIGEISLIWPILIMTILLVLGFGFIAFKDKKTPVLSTLIITFAVLIVNVALVGINIDMNSGTQNLLDETKATLEEMTNMSSNVSMMSLNISRMVNWSYDPKPQITIFSNSEHISEDGGIPLKIVYGYDSNKRYSIDVLLTWQRKRLILQIYNSGRTPLIMPLMYLSLIPENTSKTFPFRFYEISTPIQGIYFNLTHMELYEYYESAFPFQHPVNMPYRHRNIKGEHDFPPRFKNGHAFYDYPISYHDELTWSQQNISNFGYFEGMKDRFGPIRIGTVLPESVVEIHMDIFAVVDDYFNTREEHEKMYDPPEITFPFDSEKYDSEYEEYEQKINIFANGTLTVEFEALNSDKNFHFF